MPVAQRQYFLLVLPFAAALGGVALTQFMDFVGTRFNLRHYLLHAWLGCCSLTTAWHFIDAYRGWSPDWGQEELEDARPDAVRQKLNYVLEATPPEATVLNGWSSGGAFRKPAFFFIHREAKEIMREADYQRLAAVLAERSLGAVAQLVEIEVA